MRSDFGGEQRAPLEPRRAEIEFSDQFVAAHVQPIFEVSSIVSAYQPAQLPCNCLKIDFFHLSNLNYEIKKIKNSDWKHIFVPLDNRRGFTYYKMSNLDNRISNADQLLTNDIDKFCESVTDFYSNASKPILDIIIYMYKTTTNLGAKVFHPFNIFAENFFVRSTRIG